jgi:TolA-binding protein
MKYFLFIFLGTATVYSVTFRWYPWKGVNYAFPSIKNQIKLKQENEILKVKLAQMTGAYEDLRFEIEKIQAKGDLTSSSMAARALASLPKNEMSFRPVRTSTGIKVVDYVQQETYQWSKKKLGEYFLKHWKLKQYLEASQFGLTLFYSADGAKELSEFQLFQLGVACVESNAYPEEGVQVLTNYVTHYPKTKFFVRAKLWMALAQYKLGKTIEFQTALEEFKDKYQNTQEWGILSNLQSKKDGVSL